MTNLMRYMNLSNKRGLAIEAVGQDVTVATLSVQWLSISLPQYIFLCCSANMFCDKLETLMNHNP